MWASYPDRLAEIGKRFSGVLIENRPAVQVMRQHDSIDTLHYIDPPYVHETRNKGGNRRYKHEMTALDHDELLTTILSLRGHVVLSGYDNELYNDRLGGWRKETKQARISAGRGTGIRTECLWLNLLK